MSKVSNIFQIMEGYPHLIRSVSAILDGKQKYARKLRSNGSSNLSEAEYLTESVKKLLENGTAMDMSLQESILFLATCNKNEEVLRLLLDKNINVRTKVKGPFSCIHIAVEKGYLNIIELLLMKGADANARYPRKDNSEESSSLLHHAVEKGDEAIVELLLRYNANAEIKSSNGATPLHIAAEKGFEKIAEHLLKAEININAITMPKKTDDYFLEKFNENEALRFYLDIETTSVPKILVTDTCYTPLHIAIIESQENMVKFLLEHGANVDAEDSQGNSALHMAVENKCPTIVDIILSHSPDVRAASNKSALYLALEDYRAREIYDDILKKLLKYGLTFDCGAVDSYRILFEAVGSQRIEIVEKFLKDGLDVNKYYDEKNKDGKYEFMEPTLLHLTLLNDNDDMLRLLLNYGADVNAKPNEKRSPLSHVIKHSSISRCNLSGVVKLLIEKGARIKGDPDVLITAVKGNHLEVIKFLLLNGASVNEKVGFKRKSFEFEGYKPITQSHQPIDKKTALFVAAEKGYEEIVELLLANGAEASFVTNHNLTPFLVSVIQGHLKVVDLLLKHGVSVDSFDIDKKTALYLAAEMGHKDIVKLLFRNGAQINRIAKDNMTPLLISCEKGHLEIAELLLDFGANISLFSVYGRTALHIAAEFGHHDVIKLLLDRGMSVDIGCQDKNDLTALFVSTHQNHLKCVEVLLKYGSNIHHLIDGGCNALHVASHFGHPEIVKLFLKYGAKINSKCSDNQTALSYAARVGNLKTVDVLLKSGAHVNATESDNSTALYFASLMGHHEVVKLLLKHGAIARPTYKCNSGFTPLDAAADGGHLLTVAALMKAGVTTDDYFTAFSSAVEKGHDKVVELLVNYFPGFDLEEGSHIPPFLAFAKKGNLNIVKGLLKHGGNVSITDDQGITALHFASKHGHIDIVKFLLNNGAEVDARTKNFETPLVLAAAKGPPKIIEVLLKSGANIQSADSFNKTALYYAAEHGQNDVVTLLLESGANVNPEVETKSGKTPLLISAERGHFETVETLLQFGAQVDLQDSDGITALYFAAEYGHVKMVKLLLINGANIDFKGRNGIPPIIIAAERGRLQTVQILLQFGANIDLFGERNLMTHFIATLFKWDPKIFEIILEHGSADDKALSESNIRCLFDVLNKCGDNSMNTQDGRNNLLIVKSLVHHTVKMKVASVYTREETLVATAYNNEMIINNFETECKAEIEKLKCDFIGDSNISFYDILTASVCQLTIFLKNPCIDEISNSDDYELSFPLYSSVIKSKFQKGKTRKNFQDRAVVICAVLFHKFFSQRNLNDLIEKIVSYLSVNDLRILVHTQN